MVGREVNELFPVVDRQPDRSRLRSARVTVEDPDVPGKLLVATSSFAVRAGEVLGIAGLVGAGRSDLLTAIFGAHPGRIARQSSCCSAKRIDDRRPSDAIAAGIGFVTEDRKSVTACCSIRRSCDNMSLARLSSPAAFSPIRMARPRRRNSRRAI